MATSGWWTSTAQTPPGSQRAVADRQLDQALKEMASEFGARSSVVTVVEVDAEAGAAITLAHAGLVALS